MASPLDNAVRLIKPGEMVVSVSDLLESIGNKLTATEKEQLLVALLARRTVRVQPGDLITADLMNQLLADMSDLQLRLADLQQAATTEKPANGVILVTNTGGPTNLVPTKPQPLTYRVSNDTDAALRITVAAKASAPTGNWAGAALFDNGQSSVQVSIGAGRNVVLTLNVTAPAQAALQEIAEILVSVDVGPPHNKHDESRVTKPIDVGAGEPQTHTVTLGDIVFPADFAAPPPPAGVDGQLPAGRNRAITYQLRHDTQDINEVPGFVCTVRIDQPAPDVAQLGAWRLRANGAAFDTDVTDAAKGTRTLEKALTLNPGELSSFAVNLAAPDGNGGGFRYSFSVRSTQLAKEVKTSAPLLVLRSKP